MTVEPVARAFFTLVAIALLASCAREVHAQQQSPLFEDLAARAAVARDQQNISLAIELYGQAEKLKPDWAEGWFYIGLLHYTSNEFPAAIEAFNHLLSLKPQAGPALALRGLSEFEVGAYDDALRDLEDGVKNGAANEPRNTVILRYHLAQLLVRAGRFEDAVAQYQLLANQHVDDPDLLAGLGMAGLRMPALLQDVPQDKRDLLQAVGRAGYSFLSGNNEDAEKQFNQLFARYTTTPDLYFFYGTLLFTNSPELAIAQFRSEVARAPGNAYAHAVLAYTLMIAGHYAEAGPEAELALAANPNLEMAQIALGRSLAETGNIKRTSEVVHEVLQRDPDNLEAHMALAAVYSRAGKREDAYREREFCLGLAQ